MLKPTPLGDEVVINLDVLTLITLRELKYLEDYHPDKPFPMLQGSFDLAVGDGLFFVHFRFSATMLMELFDSLLAPMMVEENLQLSDKNRVVFSAPGVFAKPKEHESTRVAALAQHKRALGERGPVWWDDGAPDLNRHLARTTPYAAWYAARTA